MNWLFLIDRQKLFFFYELFTFQCALIGEAGPCYRSEVVVIFLYLPATAAGDCIRKWMQAAPCLSNCFIVTAKSGVVAIENDLTI